jgi:hypothetical protein
VRRTLHNFEEYGEVYEPKDKPRRQPKLMGANEQILIMLVEENPTFFLREFADALNSIVGMPKLYSMADVNRCFVRNKITYKKLEHLARQRDVQKRSAYANFIWNMPRDYMVSVDESHVDDATARRKYGRGRRGVPVRSYTRFGNTWGCSVIGACDINGMIPEACYLDFDGVGADTCTTYVRHILVPRLRPFPGPRSVVIMDNASVHVKEEVRALVEGAGALLFFQSPYSPDFNPIELFFAKMKRTLMGFGEQYVTGNTVDAFFGAFDSITSDDAHGFFRKAFRHTARARIYVAQ